MNKNISSGIAELKGIQFWGDVKNIRKRLQKTLLYETENSLIRDAGFCILVCLYCCLNDPIPPVCPE